MGFFARLFRRKPKPEVLASLPVEAPASAALASSRFTSAAPMPVYLPQLDANVGTVGVRDFFDGFNRSRRAPLVLTNDRPWQLCGTHEYFRLFSAVRNAPAELRIGTTEVQVLGAGFDEFQWD